MAALLLLKLGGALLTHKDRREAVRRAVLERLANEVAAWPGATDGRLVLAHGSGSFAHVAVEETRFQAEPGDPLRSAQVAAAARRLSSLVVDALLAVGLPAVAVPGSLLALCEDGAVVAIRENIVTDLLRTGHLPVLYGDAAPDRVRGGTIASTEPLLAALADELPVARIILATDVDGVFATDPHASAAAPMGATGATGAVDAPIRLLTPRGARSILAQLGGARPGYADVTGGMASKVARMLALVEAHPEVEVRILSGLRPGAVLAALRGEAEAGGTVIRAD